MEKTGLIDDLLEDHHLEKLATEKRRSHSSQGRCDIARGGIVKTLKGIGNSEDVGLIVQAEKHSILNELEFYSNSKEMQSSLTSSLKDIDAAEKTLPIVYNPEQYKLVDNNHSNQKDRQGALPLDDVRKFFKSQLTRLDTAKKHRSDDSEKQVISQRRTNLYIAEKSYISLQRQALGLESPNKSKSQNNNLTL